MHYFSSILPKLDRTEDVKKQNELFQQLTEQTTHAQKQTEQWELFRKTVVQQLNGISTKEFELSQILGQFKIDLESCKPEELPQKLQEITRVVKVLLEARAWMKEGKKIEELTRELKASRTANDELAERLGTLQAKVDQKKKANQHLLDSSKELDEPEAYLKQMLNTPKKP